MSNKIRNSRILIGTVDQHLKGLKPAPFVAWKEMRLNFPRRGIQIELVFKLTLYCIFGWNGRKNTSWIAFIAEWSGEPPNFMRITVFCVQGNSFNSFSSFQTHYSWIVLAYLAWQRSDPHFAVGWTMPQNTSIMKWPP